MLPRGQAMVLLLHFYALQIIGPHSAFVTGQQNGTLAFQSALLGIRLDQKGMHASAFAKSVCHWLRE